jgi:hypothetical protein
MRSGAHLVASVVIAMFVVVATCAAMFAITGTFAVRGTPGGGFSVFMHRAARAADTRSAPPGAVLATVSGANSIYAWHRSATEDCVVDVRVGDKRSGICAKDAYAVANGVVGIFRQGAGALSPNSLANLRVAALVPDGVDNIVFTDRNGLRYVVRVVNNVAEREDLNIASVHYTLASGRTKTINVASIIDAAASRPGSPGSSS